MLFALVLNQTSPVKIFVSLLGCSVVGCVPGVFRYFCFHSVELSGESLGFDFSFLHWSSRENSGHPTSSQCFLFPSLIFLVGSTAQALIFF
jgi:flagellar biosynthesis protein FliR